MENARYFTSVLTPTCMAHTISFRQLNYLCGWLRTLEQSDNALYKMLAPTAKEFVEKLEQSKYLVP